MEVEGLLKRLDEEEFFAAFQETEEDQAELSRSWPEADLVGQEEEQAKKGIEIGKIIKAQKKVQQTF